MIDYPYLAAWAVYCSLGANWYADIISRAAIDGAPQTAWAWAVGKGDWSTMDELAESAKGGNQSALRAHVALTVIADMIASGGPSRLEALLHPSDAGIWA